MLKKIITITSLYFIVQFCFSYATETKPVTEVIAKVAEEEAKVAEAGAEASEALAKAGAEEASNLPHPPSVSDLPPGGGPPQLSQENLQALMLSLQSAMAAPPNPAQMSAGQLNLPAANPLGTDLLTNAMKGVPNPADFSKSLISWLQPASQITQNTIDGFTDIHMRNRQPGVELMRTVSEPGAMLFRGFLAPFGQSQQVDKLRSATMKGVSDGFDNTVQFSKVLADGVPQGMQNFHTQANGFLNMSPLTF